MPSEQRLPFEPSQSRKKADKTEKKADKPPEKKAEKKTDKGRPSVKSGGQAKTPAKAAPTPVAVSQTSKKAAVDRQSMGIPEAVSQRMARRMALFCGLPTSLGMLTFVASYIVVSQNWFKLPNVAVVLVSMGFFGLGVLGLSYGILSASWDESRPGSLLGTEEFGVNFARMREAWKANRQKS